MSHPLAGTAGPETRNEGQGRQRYRSQVTDVPVVPRADFIRQFGKDYSSGQHVTYLGPTQRGKTTLALQLLSVCISPDRKAVILAGKPDGRDHTMEKAPKLLNMRRISEWPPDPSIRDRNRNGFVLRPLGRASQDSAAEDAKLQKEFGKALRSLYASKRPVIIVVDETAHVYDYLKLKRELEAPLMRGAPVVSCWNLVQRGRFITYHIYNAPEHIFMFQDPDETNVVRYSQMVGGVDPHTVQDLVSNLKTEEVKNGMTVSQCLYVRRSGPRLAIVDIH